MLPRQHAALQVLGSEVLTLLVLTVRSLAEMATSSRVEVWSVARKCGALRGKRRHPLRQWTAPTRMPSPRADTDQQLRDGVSGPFRHLSAWWLWKFVAGARDPCRSTARVSTWMRVTYTFCNMSK